MILSKKFWAVMILVGTFAFMGAMKRKVEDVESGDNKRQKLFSSDECPECPSAPQKKQPQRGRFRMRITSFPVSARYKADMESAARKDSIEQAILAQDFATTSELLATYAADVDNAIIAALFNSKFPEVQQVKLYQKLQRDGKVDVCTYKDSRLGRNIFHLFAVNNHPELFYQASLDCPRAQELVNARDDKGRTVIHLTDSPAIIEHAIRFGVDINAQNRKGNTALHEAADDSSSKKRKAAILLAFGASLNVFNKYNLNPYDFGGARNEGLNPENPDAVAREMRKGVSLKLGGQNITSNILGRATSGRIVPSTVRYNQDFWTSSSSSSSSGDDYGDE